MEEDVPSADSAVSQHKAADAGVAVNALLAAEGGQITDAGAVENSHAEGDHVTASAVEGLWEALTGLTEQVAKDHARAAARERTIDRLHEEVERLRAGEARSLLRPVITDLHRLHHDLLAEARSAADMPSRAQVSALLGSFADSVELALERCGVSVVRPAPGMPCNPGTHQIVGFSATNDASLDRTIMKTLSAGYVDIATGRPLAPARVVVYSVDWVDEDVVPGGGKKIDGVPQGHEPESARDSDLASPSST